MSFKEITIKESGAVTSLEELAQELARSLEKRVLLLKLLSMNFYDLEETAGSNVWLLSRPPMEILFARQTVCWKNSGRRWILRNAGNFCMHFTLLSLAFIPIRPLPVRGQLCQAEIRFLRRAGQRDHPPDGGAGGPARRQHDGDFSGVAADEGDGSGDRCNEASPH